jgi:2-polyprenyl-3-methyl-5-hydroxy-6-metoxy-1,4-benzoquinol methylase
MTTFDQVVKAWQGAHVDAIHPLRADDVDGYWESGWFQAQQAAAHIPAGGTVVDFGCGDGRVAIPLAHMGFGVTAVDASPTMLKRLATRAREQGNDFNPDDLELVQSDGTDLGKLKRLFDGVVCRAVLIHHGFADGERLVHQLAELLKPGAHLMIDWPNGVEHERRDWIDVSVWDQNRVKDVAAVNGLELVESAPDGYTVWKRVS